MIEAAVIDLMHQMSRPVSLTTGSGHDELPRALRSDGRDQAVHNLEQLFSEWIGETGRRLENLQASLQQEAIAPDTIKHLDQMIEVFEGYKGAEVAYWRRWVKSTRAVVKRARSQSVGAGALAEAQRDRILRAVAGYGLFKEDVITTLRILRAEASGEAGRGPIFEEPDALEAYLRGAVA